MTKSSPKTRVRPVIASIILGACTTLPDEPLEEGSDIKFPNMNRGQVTIQVRRLDRAEAIFFEGRQLDFLGAPLEREFTFNLKLDGAFNVEVRRNGERCNQRSFIYSENQPIDSLSIIAGCKSIARL